MSLKVNTVQRARVADLRRALKAQERPLELAINSEPTGEDRNLMTEVNIHLMAALDALDKLLK